MPHTTTSACPHCHVSNLTVDNAMCVGCATTLSTQSAAAGALIVNNGVTQTSGTLVDIQGTADQTALKVEGDLLLKKAHLRSEDHDFVIDAEDAHQIMIGTSTVSTHDTANINIGTSNSARTITVGNDASAKVDVNALSIELDAGSGGILLSSDGAGDITLNSDDTLLLDADGVLELNSSAGAISIGNDDVDQAINIGTDGARPITVGNSSATGIVIETTGDLALAGDIVDIVAETGTLTIDAAGAIGIGTDAAAQAINIGTDGARTITVGNVTGTTAVSVNAGTGGVALASTGTGDITLNSADNITIDASGTGGVTITGHRAKVIADPGSSTLTNNQSGAFIPLTDTDAVRAYLLPTPVVGLTYTFILTTALTAGDVTITSTTNGTVPSNLLTGILNNNGTSDQKVDLNVITFVNGTALEGDVVKVTCISATTMSGNPTWFVEAHSSASDGITIITIA
jgi:hypothetical protein